MTIADDVERRHLVSGLRFFRRTLHSFFLYVHSAHRSSFLVGYFHTTPLGRARSSKRYEPAPCNCTHSDEDRTRQEETTQNCSAASRDTREHSRNVVVIGRSVVKGCCTMRLQRPTPGALLAAAVFAVSLACATSQGYPCYQEGFYRDPNHCGRFYRCAPVRNRPGVFTLYTFGCPEGTAFDEYSRMCVEPHYDDPCFNQVSRGPAYAPHRPMHPFRAPVRSSFRDGQALPCRRDGFHAHPYDCNRFYRCVRYEQDSFYSIYEFNCPETLVYDEATGTCNYAEYSESDCISNQRQNNSWSQSKPSSGSSGWSQAGAGPGGDQWGDTHQNIEQAPQEGGGWSQVQGQESVNHGHTQNQPQGASPSGAGSYVVYVFSCGESLVWDEAQSTCNYPYAVEGRCKNAAPGPSEQPTFPEQPQGWPQQGAGGGQPGAAPPQQPQGWPQQGPGGSQQPGGKRTGSTDAGWYGTGWNKTW
ncbi:hypothetical protein MTO96_048106 [Rhipicephalus appendiculatus]